MDLSAFVLFSCPAATYGAAGQDSYAAGSAVLGCWPVRPDLRLGGVDAAGYCRAAKIT